MDVTKKREILSRINIRDGYIVYNPPWRILIGIVSGYPITVSRADEISSITKAVRSRGTACFSVINGRPRSVLPIKRYSHTMRAARHLISGDRRTDGQSRARLSPLLRSPRSVINPLSGSCATVALLNDGYGGTVHRFFRETNKATRVPPSPGRPYAFPLTLHPRERQIIQRARALPSPASAIMRVPACVRGCIPGGGGVCGGQAVPISTLHMGIGNARRSRRIIRTPPAIPKLCWTHANCREGTHPRTSYIYLQGVLSVAR